MEKHGLILYDLPIQHNAKFESNVRSEFDMDSAYPGIKDISKLHITTWNPELDEDYAKMQIFSQYKLEVDTYLAENSVDMPAEISPLEMAFFRSKNKIDELKNKHPYLKNFILYGLLTSIGPLGFSLASTGSLNGSIQTISCVSLPLTLLCGTTEGRRENKTLKEKLTPLQQENEILLNAHSKLMVFERELEGTPIKIQHIPMAEEYIKNLERRLIPKRDYIKGIKPNITNVHDNLKTLYDVHLF